MEKFVKDSLPFRGTVSTEAPTYSFSFGPPTEGKISTWEIHAFWKEHVGPIGPVRPEPPPLEGESETGPVLHRIPSGTPEPSSEDPRAIESSQFVLSLRNADGTELASGRSRLVYIYEVRKKPPKTPRPSPRPSPSDIVGPWTLTVTYDPWTPSTKVGEIVIEGGIIFNSQRPVRVKKIPLDMLNMKLDTIFNGPQPLKVTIENRDVGEYYYDADGNKIVVYHTFLMLELDRELFLGHVYEQKEKMEVDLRNTLRIAVNINDLKPHEKRIPKLKIQAVSHEGHLAFKVWVEFGSAPLRVSVLVLSPLNIELDLKDTTLVSFLILKNEGWLIIPSPVESMLPKGTNLLSTLAMYLLLGIGFNELSEIDTKPMPMFITHLLQIINTWLFGDKDFRPLGAKDEEVELYYDERPAAPRIIEDLLLCAPSRVSITGVGTTTTIAGIDPNIWEIGPGMEDGTVFMVRRTEPLPVPGYVTPQPPETPTDAIAGYYPADGAGDIIFPAPNPVWGKHWTHIIAGKFTSSEFSGLFFYSAHSKWGEIYETDGKGGLRLVKRHEDLGHWSHIIPGHFGGDGLTDLLFYNSVNCKTSFYVTESTGELRHLKTHTDWRRSWDFIIPGHFGSEEFTDLFFYNAHLGSGEFCATDGTGSIIKLKTISDLHRAWTQIIPIEFWNAKFTCLIFYDATSGRAEAHWPRRMKKRDGSTEFLFDLFKEYTPWNRDWTRIVPFRFSEYHPRSGLLFYSSPRGYSESYSCNTDGTLIPFRKHTSWRTDWRWILPGNFGGINIESAPMVIPEEHITNLKERIDHIVVLMLENRSFDHMLGFLSLHEGRSDIEGLTGHESNPLVESGAPEKTVFPLTDGTESVIPKDDDDCPPVATRFLYDPGHDFDSIRFQRGDYTFITVPSDRPWYGIIPQFEIYRIDPMKGFILAHGIRLMSKYWLLDEDEIRRMRGDIMGYYTAQHMPVYKFLADEYLICNHWHAAVPGHTWQNRYSEIAGFLAPDETGRPSPNNPEMATFEPLKTLTIFDHLSDRGRTWKYYEHDFCMLRTFSKYTFDNTNILPIEKFFEDAAAGTLPDVAYIEPDLVDISDDLHPANDDHPPSDILRGQDLVSRIHNALRGGPKWNRTLLIITYDEHGGFYDHVFPQDDPNLPALFSRKYEPVINNLVPYGRNVFETPIRYRGMRVPTFVVSPQVKQQDVSNTVYDHTTILKTIIARFLWPDPPYMGLRVAQAEDLGPLLTVPPRPNIPQAPNVSLLSVCKEWTKGVPKQVDRSDDFHYIFREIRNRLVGAQR